jgi:hypothetical protein
MLEAVTEGRSGAYSLAELVEAADGLARLVDTIRRGELTASPGAVPRLEGAIITLRSLAESWPLSADNPDRGTDQAEHVHHTAAEPLANAAGVPRGLTAAAVDTAELAAAVADALAETDRNPLDGLTAAEAIEPRGQERIVGVVQQCSYAVTGRRGPPPVLRDRARHQRLAHVAMMSPEMSTNTAQTRRTPLVKWAPSALSPEPVMRSASAAAQAAPTRKCHGTGLRPIGAVRRDRGKCRRAASDARYRVAANTVALG